MDTKLRKSNRFLYSLVFTVCVLSFMAFVTSMMLCGAVMSGDHLLGGNMWALYMPHHYPVDFFADAWKSHSMELVELRDQISVFIGISISSSLLALASFIYLCTAVGERNEEGRVILKGVDRIPTELQILVIALLAGVGGSLFIPFAYSAIMNILMVNGVIEAGNVLLRFYEPTVMTIFFAAIIGIVATGLGLWMLLSCVRKIKARCFLKESILGWLFLLFYDAIFKGGSLMRKVVLVAIAVCVFSGTAILAPVVLIALLILLPKAVRRYEEIKKGVEEVKSGNLEYKIQADGDGELDQLARGINEISQASNLAVQNELKNQRLKSELISNVSHDLKTPLTSMVTYIDLLKTEGLTSENAPEYLDVLDQKTNRLRQLTEDLFEAAKASSGAIPVRKEKVDVLSLVNQGLGEMDQRITASGLEFVMKTEQEHYFVWADGQLLWRVVENLLSNVLKYAQENTRVYIDISEQGATGQTSTMVVLEMKNISKQALNIHADELMERFTRGDEARATEGSGLGLAIAKDLVKLQGGWFEVKIDGDLFKAVVMLEKAE